MTGDPDALLPAWWRQALTLEQEGKLEAAEQAILGAVDHIGAVSSVAELYAQRMHRLAEAGDEVGAREAGDTAAEWIRHYASLATSGGEGAALAMERDAFLSRIGRLPEADPPPTPATPLERFEQSMPRTRERWHDGIGYDLEALRDAGPDHRRQIEALLVHRQPLTWHDIEALATLDTPRARARIMAALDDPDPMVRAAVTRFAGHRVARDELVAALVTGLETAELYGGLTQTLDQVATHHPPEVVAALFRGALHRAGEVAVHFAAMLMFVHGRAKEPFDSDHRPFLLTFHTEDRAARQAAFRELCRRLEVDPGRWLPGQAVPDPPGWPPQV